MSSFSIDFTSILDIKHKHDSITYLLSGISASLYLNAIWRLNREQGSTIDTDKLALEAKFVKRTDSSTTSCVLLRAKAKEQQTWDIRKYLELLYIERIFHECRCFIEFIKRVGEKRSNARLAELAEHFNSFSQRV